jgi:hypothetical protein
MIGTRQILTSQDATHIIFPNQFVILESFQVKSLKRWHQTKKRNFPGGWNRRRACQKFKGYNSFETVQRRDKVITTNLLVLGWRIVDVASSLDEYLLLVFVASGLYPFDQQFHNIGMIGTHHSLGKAVLTNHRCSLSSLTWTITNFLRLQ